MKTTLKTFAEHTRPYLQKTWQTTCIAANRCMEWSKETYYKAKPHVVAGCEKIQQWYAGLSPRVQRIVFSVSTICVVGLLGLAVAQMTGNGDHLNNAIQVSTMPVVTKKNEDIESIVKKDLRDLTAYWALDYRNKGGYNGTSLPDVTESYVNLTKRDFNAWTNAAEKNIPEGLVLSFIRFWAEDSFYKSSFRQNKEEYEKRKDDAIGMLRKAAEQEMPEAQFVLAFVSVFYAPKYEEGESSETRETREQKARQEANTWFQKAMPNIHKKAEQGNAESQLLLGVYFTQRETEEQAKWYRKALDQYRKQAEQGNAEAQLKVGLGYAMGRGFPQDMAESVKWFRKAAEQGLMFAQYQLGLCYIEGRGVSYDLEEAGKWFSKAAEQVP